MQNLQNCIKALKHWLSTPLDGDGAGMYPGATASLLPTTFAVIARELGGQPFNPGERQQIVKLILSHQQADTGLFNPGKIKRQELQNHSATYIRLQASYFAIQALDALNARPKKGIDLLQNLKNIDYTRGWLDGGPWSNPWLHSNHLMFALTFLQTDHVWHDDEASLNAYDAILDYLDNRQDPATGLWQPDDGVDVRNAVYAAYHFFPYYFWRGRRPCYIEQIIDSALSIQDADGLYGGGACEDLDAVHTLVMMTMVSDHRAGDVRRSLERCFWRLLQLQNPDGGFSNYVRRPRSGKGWKRRMLESTKLIHVLPKNLQNRNLPKTPVWRYSGWKQLECPYAASDTWGSWFRPLAIKLIADQYPDMAGEVSAGSFRTLPGLGWHDVERILAAKAIPSSSNDVGLKSETLT